MLTVLLACGNPDHEPHPKDKPGEPTTPSTSWTVPTGTTPPTLDVDGLTEGLAQAVALVPQLSADPPMAAYDSVMAYSGGYCPSTYGYATGTYGGYSTNWYSQCDTPGGATFSGYAGDYQSDDYGDSSGYRGLYVSATVVDPQDRVLTAAGYWSRSVVDYGYELYTYDYLDGTMAYDAAVTRGTWIEDGLAPHELTIDAGEGDGWRYQSLDGQVTGLAGPIDTVDYTDVYYDSGYRCAEPTGTISLRTTEADWFDVVFTGGDGAEGADCDGCGAVWWRGLELGEVCSDFTPWKTGGR
ncbi:MAG: hypothetical protein ABMA64_31330 [Myxococcota bacterium]